MAPSSRAQAEDLAEDLEHVGVPQDAVAWPEPLQSAVCLGQELRVAQGTVGPGLRRGRP